MSYFSQSSYSVRLEWGARGFEYLGRDVDCVVVVDVMSFSTCVSIAVDRGAIVFPYPWRDETAKQYGENLGAVVASAKRRFGDGYSLSPTSLASVPQGLKLVLPSPNGSAAAYQARDLGIAVLCGCFRNMAATAAACKQYSKVLILPCGERWEDQSLRPSLEDYIAAGGIVAALDRGDLSPEARAAALAFDGLGTQRTTQLAACSSGVELSERGFGADITLCLEENVSSNACLLEMNRFVPWSHADQVGI